MGNKIYLICSVRGATEERANEAEEYVKKLESNGYKVYYPPRDCDQTDDGIGMNICFSHRNAIKGCDEVHVLWYKDSIGSHFDFGMAFAFGKPIILVNNPQKTEHKSYTNVLIELDKKQKIFTKNGTK